MYQNSNAEEQKEEELDRRHLILLQFAIGESGDLATAAAFCDIPMDAIIAKCRKDEEFRRTLEFALGKFHFKLYKRVNDLAFNSRKRYIWNEQNQSNDVEYIPNEKMVVLAAQLHIANLNKNGEGAAKDFSHLLPDEMNENKPSSEQTISYHELSPELRKQIAKELLEKKKKTP